MLEHLDREGARYSIVAGETLHETDEVRNAPATVLRRVRGMTSGAGIALRTWTPVVAMALAVQPVRPDVVLLDEHWAPETTVNEVVVTEIDAKEVADPTVAKSGDIAAVLTNDTGWPNVRFRGASTVKLADIPPGDSEARLWYRTDKWDGKWQLQLWAYRHGLTNAGPVKVLEATLDGGGEGGKLLADDEWHQAKGVLEAVGDYAKLPKEDRLQTYVWLVPKDGWDKPHGTYVDRCEIAVVKGPKSGVPAPKPMRRVRPKPGAQTSGDGWIWWEAEDAAEHDLPAGGAYGPDTEAQQDLLSNGWWLQYHDWAGKKARWEVEVAEAGKYTLWARGFGPDGRARLRWNGSDWKVFAADDFKPVDWTLILDLGWWQMEVCWAPIGEVELAKGRQTLTVDGLPGAGGLAIDCWVLIKKPWKPTGTAKPKADAG
jgi:hypothetical protein